MSTRSMIGKAGGDGHGVAVYCHGDGYPNVVGRILNAHYRDEERVDALMALGDRYYLDGDGDEAVGAYTGEDARPATSFEGGAAGFFRTDWGEKAWAEWVYCWTADRGWLVSRADGRAVVELAALYDEDGKPKTGDQCADCGENLTLRHMAAGVKYCAETPAATPAEVTFEGAS